MSRNENAMADASKPPLEILLCAPRGFCAGVDRAIQIVELALQRFGAPVYVRHEIVHNRYVVDGLREKGAVFVEELDEIPDDGQPVVFSAHGVPKSVPEDARAREMFFLDATCPLVSKVHKEAQIHFKRDREIVLIGHAGHPEVIGTMGQLPDGSVTLIETVADARAFTPKNPEQLAFITQTTLSVDDTSAIVKVLTERFPYPTQPEANAAYRRLRATAPVDRVYPASIWLFGCKPGALDEQTARVTRYRGPVVHCVTDFLDGSGRRARRETANFYYYGAVWNMQPVYPPHTAVPWRNRERSPKDFWWWVPGRPRYE